MLKRAVISTLQPLVANHVYTVRHGLARGLRRRGGLGFVPQVGSPSREEAFLEQLDFEGETVFDVGGYEGVFALFFARRIGSSGRLVTFEPNPQNYARIVENVKLNGFANVDVRPLALGAQPARASLVFPTDETARGSLLGDIQDQIRREKSAAAVDVDVETIDRLTARDLPVPDFVKIDVEGFERDVLEGMTEAIARRRPRLYIEIHGADRRRKLENATSVVQYLWRAAYRVHHVESASNIERPLDIACAIEGHLYCQ
jgi:FkbM family methyltransferase